MISILFLAAVPFAVKLVTLAAGVSGYGLQSLYKIAQLLVPAGWRYASGERGCAIVWPTSEKHPSILLIMIGIGMSIALSSAAIVLIVHLAPALGLDPVELRRGYDNRFAVSGTMAVVIVLFLAFLNSALEELHFRVWLDRELSKRAGSAFGITISACAFGGMHGFIVAGLPGIPVVGIVLMAAGLAVAGACWSLMLRRPGGIYAAWLSHGLTDALLLGWGLFWLGYL